MTINHGIDVNAARRLAFVRYLHHVGIEQARRPVPMSSTSILTLHDAVESFLLLAAEHLQVNPPDKFMGYWATLKSQKGIDLAMKQGMTRLNNMRVALKHHGTHPDLHSIEQAVSDTATFMTENTPLVFGIDFDSISMAHAIPQQEIRDLVHKADKFTDAEDHVSAMIALIDAFIELFDHDPHDARSPFTFGMDISFPMSTSDIAEILAQPDGSFRRHRTFGWHETHRLADQISNVTTAVSQLRSTMRITSLGIDFAAYRRFRRLTPDRSDHFGGGRKYSAPKGYSPTSEHVTFCIQFIVDASLRLATAEAQLERPPWIPEIGNPAWLEWETIHEVTPADDGKDRAAETPQA